jgi:hypothetical protein
MTARMPSDLRFCAMIGAVSGPARPEIAGAMAPNLRRGGSVVHRTCVQLPPHPLLNRSTEEV